MLIDKMELGDELSRAMELEAWTEYDAGNGKCSHQSFWKILTSLDHATIVLGVLEEKGLINGP